MAATIELPDGTRATIHGQRWSCSDPKAIPVLEFFAKRVQEHIYTDPDGIIAWEVAKVIVGSRFISADPPGILLPGAVC
jgi:hypothetical protein